MSKKQQAELLRQEKKDKEARAIARAEAAALLRSAAKEKERARVAREEKEGAEARKQALADLKHKRAEIAVKEGSGDPLKKQKTSPHMDDVCGPDSDDNSGNTTDIGELVPGSPTRSLVHRVRNWIRKAVFPDEAAGADVEDEDPDEAEDSDESDGGLDGAALLARQKDRAKREAGGSLSQVTSKLESNRR
ncbi:hypothetical protein AM587_10000183 [Phytophthora nicotianae]|uniref:Uncharacterized protein n=1 Tax=Phytophthora nicotianae TaxID=4792 RepID=A0A0W8CC27_PHYNI|nr:hypothetical protein AM587_10000183 [Phytophthora nicotianae]